MMVLKNLNDKYLKKTLKTLKWKSITENVFSSVQRKIVWTMIYKADSTTTTANEAT